MKRCRGEEGSVCDVMGSDSLVTPVCRDTGRDTHTDTHNFREHTKNRIPHTQTGREQQKLRVTLSLAHNRPGHFVYPS